MKHPFKRYLKKLKAQKRSLVLAGALSVILVIASIFSLTLHRSTDTQTQESASAPESSNKIDTADTLKATLLTVEGTVEGKTDSIWEPVARDASLSSGMSIKTTGASSRAIIGFEEGSELRIGPNSEIRLETLSTARIVVHHESGHAYSRVNPTDDKTYIIRSENAEYEALGTAFQTIVSGDEEAVEVFENSIEETINNKRAKAGEKLTVRNFGDSSKNNSISRLDIEQLKANSFISWNRELDLKNTTFKNKLGFLSDIEGPKISITNPPAGSVVSVDANATTGAVTISGTTEKGSKLTVLSKSLAGSSPVEVPVDGNGGFSTASLNAPLGSSVFEFVAMDPTGNKTTMSTNYLFSKTAQQEQSIDLQVNTDDPNKLIFSWNLEGISTPDGIQLIYNRTGNPSYPKDNKSLTSKGTSIEVKKPGSGTYYFSVCRYSKDDNSCDIYSNVIELKLD